MNTHNKATQHTHKHTQISSPHDFAQALSVVKRNHPGDADVGARKCGEELLQILCTVVEAVDMHRPVGGHVGTQQLDGVLFGVARVHDQRLLERHRHADLARKNLALLGHRRVLVVELRTGPISGVLCVCFL